MFFEIHLVVLYQILSNKLFFTMENPEQIIDHLDKLVYEHFQQVAPLLHLLQVRDWLKSGQSHFQHHELIGHGLEELLKNLLGQHEEIGRLVNELNK